MKLKIALIAIISILLISATHPPQSKKSAFQIQSEKQLAAMEDINTIAIGVVDYIIDIGKAPDHTGKYDENSKIYKTICPYYLETLPMKDPWGNNYLIYCGEAGNGQYGISECIDDDFVVVCLGMDGKKESLEFSLSDPEAWIFKVKVLDDFNKDLVNWGGSWIRAPEAVLEMEF